jgi:hypothetical protein
MPVAARSVNGRVLGPRTARTDWGNTLPGRFAFDPERAAGCGLSITPLRRSVVAIPTSAGRRPENWACIEVPADLAMVDCGMWATGSRRDARGRRGTDRAPSPWLLPPGS